MTEPTTTEFEQQQPEQPAGPQPAAPTYPAGEIVAGPSWFWYRIKWIVMGLVFSGWGAWSIYDGFVAWPRANEEARAKGYDELPHDQLGIQLNKIIGIVLTPGGLLMAAWSLYNSRGQYRLTADDTLHVPGHEPVAMHQVRAIDKTQWDRKGIAYIEYERADGGGAGRLRLDDYLYERKPTDDILERIEAAVLPPEGAGAGEEVQA